MRHPTRDDPALRAWSQGLGGPTGRHWAPHRWWTPARLVVALATLAGLLALLQKAPCVAARWSGGDLRYARMCYSDLPYLYSGRGYAELAWPYAQDFGRWPGMEYPVGIAVAVWGVAWLTQQLVALRSGAVDLEARRALPTGDLWAAAGAGGGETALFVALTAVTLVVATVLAAYLLVRAQPERPWDAALLACSPVLVLTLLVNWDAWALVLVAGALLAWSRGRSVLAGVLVGLGTAVKLHPLLLLGAFVVVAWRRGEPGSAVRAVLAAVVAWAAVNLPFAVLATDRWLVFWTFNSDRGADLGSVWLAAAQLGATVPAGTINLASWLLLGAACAGVLALGLLAPRPPRVAQLAFLVVLAFVVVNKVYSPQYVLWLLPLAVLARPRVRDLAVWQAGEVLYFAAVWWHLGGFTASSATGGADPAYVAAILLRVAAQLWLGAVVVRDVLRPHHDPVRVDGTDDPLHPSGRSRTTRVGGKPGAPRGS